MKGSEVPICPVVAESEMVGALRVTFENLAMVRLAANVIEEDAVRSASTFMSDAGPVVLSARLGTAGVKATPETPTVPGTVTSRVFPTTLARLNANPVFVEVR
jgi:hypothetical protein